MSSQTSQHSTAKLNNEQGKQVEAWCDNSWPDEEENFLKNMQNEKVVETDMPQISGH